jgi:hypothetical protein
MGHVMKLTMADVVQVNKGTGLHLSQNVCTYTYAETTKEGIIQTFKEMCVVGTN